MVDESSKVSTPSSKTPSNPTNKKQQDQQQQSRLYANQTQVDSDLYKLELSYFVKNNALNPATDAPDIEKVEHVHYFRTIDSEGRHLHTCNRVGGHFHEIKLKPGSLDITVGPAMKEVLRTDPVTKRKKVVAIALEDDTHTHDWRYMKSDRVQIRQYSTQFMQLQATVEANKPQPVPGIFER